MKKIYIIQYYIILECKKTEDLPGFNYSHDGYWKGNYTSNGMKTILECANACGQGCFAIDTEAWSDDAQPCYHHNNKDDLTDANKMWNSGSESFRSYIKCR